MGSIQVSTSREHIIALMGVTLCYPYEVRNEKDYLDDIGPKVPKDKPPASPI